MTARSPATARETGQSSALERSQRRSDPERFARLRTRRTARRRLLINHGDSTGSIHPYARARNFSVLPRRLLIWAHPFRRARRPPAGCEIRRECGEPRIDGVQNFGRRFFPDAFSSHHAAPAFGRAPADRRRPRRSRHATPDGRAGGARGRSRRAGAGGARLKETFVWLQLSCRRLCSLGTEPIKSLQTEYGLLDVFPLRAKLCARSAKLRDDSCVWLPQPAGFGYGLCRSYRFRSIEWITTLRGQDGLIHLFQFRAKV